MLQESYQQSNHTIAENKQLQNQLSILRLEMEHQKENAFGLPASLSPVENDVGQVPQKVIPNSEISNSEIKIQF